MELKKATAVNQDKLHSFFAHHEPLQTVHDINEHTSYVIEQDGSIISWFQIDYLNHDDLWLKKLFIVQSEALKLPDVLQTIVKFANRNKVTTIYVHSKQPVTDLLLSSFSFTLQPSQRLQPFQLAKRGNWWSYTFSDERKSG